MPRLTAGRVAAITGGRLAGNPDVTATTVVHDSRSVVPGAAFAAVGGGNGFVREALDAGAPFAIADRETDASPVVVVEDTTRALMQLATQVRREMDVRVVGITGSTGKTLTKDLVAAVLATRFSVHSSQKSFNNEIGVPLVVLSCPDGTDVMVNELAARHVGEIAELCAIVTPAIGIITGIGITHLDEFGSRDAIAKTKSELLGSLPPDGVAIVPSNDDYIELLKASTRARVRTVGPDAPISYEATRIDERGRTYGVVRAEGRDVNVTLPIAGRALLRNAALAIACGLEFGIDPDEAAEAISNGHLSSFRMEIVEIDGWTIVNDAYNANPTSVESALRSVKEMASGRPVWAVLGPMAELGPASDDAHVQMGRLASELSYDGVIAIGSEADLIAQGAGSIASVAAGADEAADAVVDAVPSGALVLVKASRVVSLERFPEILRARTHDPRRKA